MMKVTYHQDNHRTIYHGDCRSMPELPDESVHCVVTSPPYWGLRKYSGEQELVWGGDNNCEHQWGSRIISKANDSNRSTLEWTTGGSPASKILGQKVSQGQFCLKCSAWRGALGLEPTPELYIQHTIEILREIRRVLRKDGVVFWNIGDSYASTPPGNKNPEDRYSAWKTGGSKSFKQGELKRSTIVGGLKPKDLCLIPFHLAIAAREDGWWVRSNIIWNKLNPMPESVNGWRWERHGVKVRGQLKGRSRPQVDGKDDGRGRNPDASRLPDGNAQYQDCPGCPKCSPNDGYVLRKGSWRPTDAHEYILMLTKTDEYYCDAEAVREQYTEPLNRWGGDTLKRDTSKTAEYKEMQNIGYSSAFRVGRPMRANEAGRNLRSVWTFPTQSYPGAHFATFPEKLPEICIKAATPEVGVCANCGAPWARIIETVGHQVTEAMRVAGCDSEGKYHGTEQKDYDGIQKPSQTKVRVLASMSKISQTLGWKPSCQCGTEDKVPAVVLDPFMGSGTTLLVATKLGRRAIGYDISEEYCRLAVERNKQIGLV